MPYPFEWIWHGIIGIAVSLGDKSPLGALSTRKTNNANTAGPVSFRVVDVTIENVELKCEIDHIRDDASIN